MVVFLDLYLGLPFPYGLVPNRQGNPAPVRYRIPLAIVLPTPLPPAPEKRLLEKPRAHVISGRTPEWIRDWLSGRRQ
jgi:hypothetical protein